MQHNDLDAVARDICRSLGYSCSDRVGEGAFKKTYRAESSGGDTHALKVFKPGFSPERTQREIEAMSRCQHPNIAKLHHVAVHEFLGQAYLFTAEEYLAGGTLTARLEGRGRLTLSQALDLGMILIDAVDHIASHGLVHRDLKPDNVMLRSDGETPVIVDFGLVRNLEDTSLTQSWQMRGPGTPYYSAPEQLNNDKHQINWRSDQFSLGLLLAISALGLHPFEQEGDVPVRTIERMARHEPQTDRFLRAAEDFGLPVLVKMTAPWPVGRYRRPAKLAEVWEEQRG